MRKICLFSVVAAACILWGCGDPEPQATPVVETQVDVLGEHASRLDGLEQGQREILAALRELQAARAAVPVTPVAPAHEPTTVSSGGTANVEAAVFTRIENLVQEHVKDVVEATIDERLGSRRTIQAVFESVVAEEISALEERKRQEEEEEAQRRREERERERAEREEQSFNTFADALELDDEQRKTVRAVSEETRETIRQTMTQMREDGRFAPEDYRAAIELIRGQQHEAMNELLSETQYKVYMEEYDGRVGDRFGGRGFGGRGSGGPR